MEASLPSTGKKQNPNNSYSHTAAHNFPLWEDFGYRTKLAQVAERFAASLIKNIGR
jgi:hypothetical protein